MINLRELLEGYPSRLRNVMRFSTCRVQYPESVAEHSYYVILYSLLITEYLNNSEEGRNWYNSTGTGMINLGKALKRSTLHDLEECRSGDFPRPFKYSNPKLKEFLDEAGAKAFTQAIQSVVSDTKMRGSLYLDWYYAKDDSDEGKIVEFADFLAVLSFLLCEGAANGNRSIREHVGEMRLYFQKFETDDYVFLHELVTQARVIVNELFPERLDI